MIYHTSQPCNFVLLLLYIEINVNQMTILCIKFTYLELCVKVKDNSQRFEIVTQSKFLCDFLLELFCFPQVFVLLRKDDIDQILGCSAVHEMIAPELHPLTSLSRSISVIFSPFFNTDNLYCGALVELHSLPFFVGIVEFAINRFGKSLVHSWINLV